MEKEYKDIEPAKAKREQVLHLWKNPNWIAEEKSDGYRYLMHLGKPCSRIYMTSRRNEEVGKTVQQFAPQINISDLGYTVIDGEVVPPEGSEFHNLASYVRVDPLVALMRRKSGEIKYKVFDILFLNNTDLRKLPLERRLEILDSVLNTIFQNHPFVGPIKRAYNNTYQFFLNIVANGGEGVVLKNLKSSYGAGWIKAKRVSTFDIIIGGFEPGYDLPIGSIKMFVCDGQNLREVGKCAIADAHLRMLMNKEPRSFVGKVAEVCALKIDPKNGMLREPRFVRMRPDLKAIEITWEKLKRDALKISLE